MVVSLYNDGKSPEQPASQTSGGHSSAGSITSPLGALPSTRRICQVLRTLDGLTQHLRKRPGQDQFTEMDLVQDAPRREHRIPISLTIAIQPLESDNRAVVGELQRAETVDISASGICIAHHAPIAHRHVAVVFGWGDEGADAIVTRLIWCRFSREGQYYSGGRFVDAISLNLKEPRGWSSQLPPA